MSKPRYSWWPYVKGMIRDYPKRKARYEDIHTPAVIARYGERMGNGGASRTTETVALRELPSTEQREYEAVRQAIIETEKIPGGVWQLKLIKLVYWDRTHRLYGAAMECNVSDRTGRQWNGDFIRRVAGNFGLLDEDCTPEPKTCAKIVS